MMMTISTILKNSISLTHGLYSFTAQCRVRVTFRISRGNSGALIHSPSPYSVGAYNYSISFSLCLSLTSSFLYLQQWCTQSTCKERKREHPAHTFLWMKFFPFYFSRICCALLRRRLIFFIRARCVAHAAATAPAVYFDAKTSLQFYSKEDEKRVCRLGRVVVLYTAPSE